MKMQPAALLVLLAVAACDRPAPPPPAETVLTAGQLEHRASFKSGVLASAREAARAAGVEYARSQDPAAKIRGVASLYLADNAFMVLVDVGREPVRLLAVEFFPEEGAPYWRARPLAAVDAQVYGQQAAQARAASE